MLSRIFGRSVFKQLNYEVVKLPNLMEGEFQDQGQLDKYLEEWLSPGGIQSVHGFFSEEEKQESTWMEYSAPEGAIISNQDPEGETSTMVINK